MTKKNQIALAFLAAFVVTLCWIIGDVALVGFEPQPERYSVFAKTYADRLDVDTAVHMLEGSTPRLKFGALVGALSAPFLLPAMWLVCQYFKNQQSIYVRATYWLLLAGAMLSPLAHAAFFYVGEIYKLVLASEPSAHSAILTTADGFVSMLNISWLSAISVLAMGWIAVAVAIVLGKTYLPRWVAVLSPVPLSFLILGLKVLLPTPYSAWLGAATFNVAYLIFFVVLFGFKNRVMSNV